MSSRRRGTRPGQRTFKPHVLPSAGSVLPDPEASQHRLERVALDDIDDVQSEDEVRIRDVEVVGTFNWLTSLNTVVLAVPGKPPRWQQPVQARDLNEDGGIYYRDVNSAHYPSFPTEPAVRAILKSQPQLETSGVDLFGCGNTIGSLLSFVQGEDRTFRLGLDLIGTTLFLVRKTNTPGETISDIRGYGHSFPEAYTAWEKDVKGSISHQRIIKYKFAGLNCFVRSESDGYLPDLVDSEAKDDQREVLTPEKPPTDLSDLLALNLGLRKPVTETKSLNLQPAGKVIPQNAIFDLKTRSIKVKDREGVNVDGFLHRLWVNQTPNMILAYHKWGKFEIKDIHVVDVREKLTAWETQHEIILRKLGDLLHKLIDFAKWPGHGKCEIRRTGSGPLEIWSDVPGSSALPFDLRKLFGEEKSLSFDDEVVTHVANTTEESDGEDYLKF